MFNNAVWTWDIIERQSFEQCKSLITQTPVLKYFDKDSPITLQCDASQFACGAVLLQHGHPVIYISRKFTHTEQLYAQIEKETLAIVFACSRLHQYLIGHPDITVESDHAPLQSLLKKSMLQIPRRLQRMRLFLQKYDLNVIYKRGKDLVLADCLSRAPLPTTQQEMSDLEILILQELEMVTPILHQAFDDAVLGKVKSKRKRMKVWSS